MFGFMRGRVLYEPRKANCGCVHEQQRRRRPPRLREEIEVEARRPRKTDAVVVDGMRRGSQCRPFLIVQKDQAKFAACNALAEELGPIDCPDKAFQIIEDAIGSEVNEVFGFMGLDLHLRFKGLGETGRGEPSSVMAPLKPTLQAAIADGSHAIIIFHVHPSGIEAEPSEADQETTEAFAEACETLDLPLIDHIIVGGDQRNRNYYSFAEDKTI